MSRSSLRQAVQDLVIEILFLGASTHLCLRLCWSVLKSIHLFLGALTHFYLRFCRSVHLSIRFARVERTSGAPFGHGLRNLVFGSNILYAKLPKCEFILNFLDMHGWKCVYIFVCHCPLHCQESFFFFLSFFLFSFLLSTDIVSPRLNFSRCATLRSNVRVSA